MQTTGMNVSQMLVVVTMLSQESRKFAVDPQRRLHRCIPAEALRPGLGGRLFGQFTRLSDARSASRSGTLETLTKLDAEWVTCYPIFNQNRRHSWPRALWDAQQPFCYRRGKDYEPLDGTCSIHPSNVTSVGLLRGLRDGEWLFGRSSPSHLYMGGGWLNTSSRLHGHRSACWEIAGRTTRCLPLWIGIGLHKSGTSTLFDAFRGVGRGKEPRFWETDRGAKCHFPNLDCGYFQSLRSDQWFGDATVPHTWHVHAPLFIHHVNPKQKFIVTLREPLDLLESHYYFSFPNFTVSAFVEMLKEDLTNMISCQLNSTWRQQMQWGWDPACFFVLDLNGLRDVLFADSLHPWLARFDDTQFLFISMHSLSRNPERISKFLGLPEQLVGKVAQRNVNTAHINTSSRLLENTQFADVKSVLQLVVQLQNKLLSLMSRQAEEELFKR